MGPPRPAHEVEQRERDGEADAADARRARPRRRTSTRLSQNSAAVARARRTHVAGSRSACMAAAITIAASAALGRLRNRPGTNTSMAMISSGADHARSPASGRPRSSATGVRDALALIEKPWKNPVATLATPSATSSWFGSTRTPLLGRVACATARWYRRRTRRRCRPPRPPGRPARPRRHVGHLERRAGPAGSTPTRLMPSSARSKRRDHQRWRPRRPGARRGPAAPPGGRTRMMASAPRPRPARWGSSGRRRRRRRSSRSSSMTSVRVGREAEQLGQLARR